MSRGEGAHTLGPYFLTEPAGIYALDESGQINRFYVLANTGFVRGIDMAGEEELLATARLFHASPDLLAALKACHDQFAFYASEHRAAGKHEKAETNERFASIARAAIAKARGDA